MFAIVPHARTLPSVEWRKKTMLFFYQAAAASCSVEQEEEAKKNLQLFCLVNRFVRFVTSDHSFTLGPIFFYYIGKDKADGTGAYENPCETHEQFNLFKQLLCKSVCAQYFEFFLLYFECVSFDRVVQ